MNTFKDRFAAAAAERAERAERAVEVNDEHILASAKGIERPQGEAVQTIQTRQKSIRDDGFARITSMVIEAADVLKSGGRFDELAEQSPSWFKPFFPLVDAYYNHYPRMVYIPSEQEKQHESAAKRHNVYRLGFGADGSIRRVRNLPNMGNPDSIDQQKMPGSMLRMRLGRTIADVDDVLPPESSLVKSVFPIHWHAAPKGTQGYVEACIRRYEKALLDIALNGFGMVTFVGRDRRE